MKMSLERPRVTGGRPVRWLKNLTMTINTGVEAKLSMGLFCHNWMLYCPYHYPYLEYSMCSLDLAMNKTTLAAVVDLSNVLKDLKNLGRRRS